MKNIIKKLFFTKFNKFLIGGIIKYIIKVGLTLFLTEIIKLWYFASYSITLSILILFSFFYNAHITFKVKNNKTKNFFKFSIVLVIFYILDALSVKILTDTLKIQYMISIIIVTTILFIIRFIVYDKFIFVEAVKTKNIPGNFYNKYESKNPIVKILMKQYLEILFKFINYTNSNNILDAGCGEGYTTSKIQSKFKNIKIEGSDLEEEVINKAKKDYPNIKFTTDSIYNLKRKDKSFNTVTILEVLEHLEDPNKAIKEAKRVASHYCIFSVPYEPFWRIANMIRLAYLSQLGNTPGHIQHWTKYGFRKLLKKHFTKIHIKRAGLWSIAICKIE